jgi:hypothetical protein
MFVGRHSGTRIFGPRAWRGVGCTRHTRLNHRRRKQSLTHHCMHPGERAAAAGWATCGRQSRRTARCGLLQTASAHLNTAGEMPLQEHVDSLMDKMLRECDKCRRRHVWITTRRDDDAGSHQALRSVLRQHADKQGCGCNRSTSILPQSWDRISAIS